ncbi:MAG: 5-formyltetrahydrofolate cyclo-ligase, partial [Clostridia bacterium]|nr:5-formyltetrahydrofolate cyclo-ligase [Clostridia bacterium]
MDKTQLRRLLKEKRKTLSPEQKKAMDQAIVDHIAATQEFREASVLLLYAPMEGEINLLPLARLAREAGKSIAFPRCDVQTNTMVFHILTPEARLSEGAYGIAEPPLEAPICVPDEKALCILPALTFDLAGNRLGYGKGYYDRYLADFPGVTVGAVYASFLVRGVPVDGHDIPVGLLATEQGILTCQEARETLPVTEEDFAEESGEEKETLQKKSVADRVKSLFASLGRAFSQSRTKPLHLPPVLVLCTYLLLLLSRVVDTQLLDRENEYLGVILLQVLIFIIPAAVYCRIAGESFTSRIRMKPIRPTQIFFVLFMLIIMVTGSLLTSILTGGIASLSGNFTLYGTFVAHTGTPLDILYAILAYALLPAFGEELVYRSILCAEYEGRGVAVSVSVSALFFAMLHFSIEHFLTYFVL